SPDFIALSGPNILPTVAPMPQPILPCLPSFVDADLAAVYPISKSGLILLFPILRSKITADGTIGTLVTPTSNPIPCSSKYLITPDAASTPNAEPPDKTIPCIFSIIFLEDSKSVSLVPGAEPLTSTPAVAPSSQIIVVQPVIPSWELL